MKAARKLARRYFVETGQPRRGRAIARRRSHHGSTLGTLAAGGNAWRRAPYAPLLSDAFSHLSPAFAYRERRGGGDEAAFVARLAGELEAEFRRAGPDTVAAFIAEPVVGATAGCVPAPPGYLRSARNLRPPRRAAVPGRADERHGPHRHAARLGAGGHRARHPGGRRGLGGGYQPIGAALASGRVVDAIERGTGAFQHGHTHQARAVVRAAALEVQRAVREEDLPPTWRRWTGCSSGASPGASATTATPATSAAAARSAPSS